MLTSYSRVTVVSEHRRVDLALPSALPLSDVVPQVLRFCVPDDGEGGPSEFTLAKVGGQSLPLSQSLAEAGVHDGDVIELRAFGEEARAAHVEDVRDTLEDSVDAAGGAWTTRSTATFAIIAASGFLLALLARPLMRTFNAGLAGHLRVFWQPDAVLAGAVASVVLIGATWLGVHLAARWVPYFCSTVAALWAFVAGVQAMAHTDGRGSTDLVVALSVGGAAALVAAALSRAVTQRAIVLLAAATLTLTGTVIVLVGAALGAPAGVMVRVVALVAVLGIGIMPRVSIAVGGLSSADYRVRNAAVLTAGALRSRIRESSGMLMGVIVGTSVLVGLIGYWLGMQPDAWGENLWDGLLSVSLAVGLLLRSRVFSRIQYMIPLRIAGLFVLLATVQQLTAEPPEAALWVPAGIAVAGLAALAVTAVPLSDVTRARIKRTLNLVEFIVIIDLVVVTMGAVALYDWVR